MRWPLAGGRGGSLSRPLLRLPVGDEALEAADGHRIALLAEHALRSHCSSCGQTRPQTAGRALVSLTSLIAAREVALGDAADEARDVDADRAAVDAARLLAGQAARGLLDGQLGV